MPSSDFLWQSFITLLVIVDPFAVLPVFINLMANESKSDRIKTARKATLIATFLVLIFAFLGDKLLDVMGISEPAFRIAGGFLLLLVAIDMVVAANDGIRQPTGDETREATKRQDVSVFPLAIPLIAGPGALVSVVVLMRQAETHGSAWQVSVIIIVAIVMAITYLTLRMSSQLMRILGVTGANVLTRVFGIILASLAVQNIINGILIVIKNFKLG
jgi:multiple antibiotic resistance protein